MIIKILSKKIIFSFINFFYSWAGGGGATKYSLLDYFCTCDAVANGTEEHATSIISSRTRVAM